MKICIKCKIEKNEKDFSLASNKIKNECKSCVAKRSSEWYKKNKERANEKRRQYYINNREKALAQCKKRYLEKHEEIRRKANERNRTPEARAKANERSKLWAKNNKEKHVAAATKHRKNNPEKFEARQQVFWAVKLGMISPKEQCEICMKTTKTHGHHDDYLKPLEVRWLCRLCHSDWHRNNKE